jgi:triosephosphate isomerase (TIM)
MRKKIAAGNWKMNLGPITARAFVNDLLTQYPATCPGHPKIILAVPAIDLTTVASLLDGHKTISLAAQNLHQADKGAYTGEISAPMLVEAGCTHTLVGHSERREYFHEDNLLLHQKVRQALKNGLTPIYCFGETLAEREADQTFGVVEQQLREGLLTLEPAQFQQAILAYEPVWAIGTGKVATPAQAQEVHAYVRNLIQTRYGEEIAQETTILYGGSVKPDNAQELFACPDIDGGLVGGASLNVADFLAIANALP